MSPNILDAIPVVGHIKAGLHYLVGDSKGGDRAFFEATRSAAVIGGGALGAVGGPVGTAAGAVGAGMLIDLLSTLAKGAPEGVFAGVTGIVGDIANGEIPIEPTLELLLCVSGDVMGGIGGGVLSDAVKKTAQDIVGKEAGKELVKILSKTTVTHALTRVFNPEEPSCRRQKHSKTQQPSETRSKKSKPEKSKGADSSLGSGSDPPEKNQNKINKEYFDPDTHWNALFKIFGVMCLDDICLGKAGIHIFKGLEDGQKRSLKKLISDLRKHGDTYFVKVVNIVAKIFNESDDDVTFQNFISLTQFVITYVGEEVASCNDKLRVDNSTNKMLFKNRQRLLMEVVTTKLVQDIERIYNTYCNLKMFISFQLHRISPSFRNDVAAVHHYFKHRFAPDQTYTLSAEEYFELILASLEKLNTLPQFSELSKSRRELVYERYINFFKRRLRTVIKVQGGNLELSSTYFLTTHIPGDKDGDEFVDGKKIRRWIIDLLSYGYKLYFLIAFIIFLLSLLLCLLLNLLI